MKLSYLRNPRFRRWLWNTRVKHVVRFWLNPQYREEIIEYELELAKEKSFMKAFMYHWRHGP